MTLKARITEDMKAAMRARDAARLSRIELTDADVLSILDKMVKQRKDSITQFEAGHRPDLAAAEQAEIAVLQDYLPQPLSASAVEVLIDAAIAATGAAGVAGMGKVMAVLKPQLAGRADLAAASARVRARLAG